MLVEADAVVAEPVELLPGLEMLGVGAHRDVGLEVLLGQRIGQLVADLQMVEVLAIGQQIEDEDLHWFGCPSELSAESQADIYRSLPPRRCCDNQKIDKPAMTE